MLEFTGERVVPDQVNPDLWSEHLARYAFARRYARGKRILDCGCGTGYGSAELAEVAAEVTGIDISNDAVEYARLNYARANTRYVTGSCLNLAFPAESFDLLVAFEVIEHVADFRRFLDQCARVLRPDGILLLSTPNKSYYAESRAETGPNPFHEHEFDAHEFDSELRRIFPHVALFLQNRVESFAFTANSFESADSRVEGDGGAAEHAHFFIALCSRAALPDSRSFIYVPRAANLLREREQHIRLLDHQLRRTQEWLAETQADRDRLLKQYYDHLDAFEKQKQELEAHNRWAENLSHELDAARQRIGQLQRELAREQETAIQMAAAYETKIRELETENAEKTKWAVDTDARLTAEIERVAHELTEALRLLKTAEETVVERTKWAQDLERKLNAARDSRWVRIGRKMGFGPDLQ